MVIESLLYAKCYSGCFILLLCSKDLKPSYIDIISAIFQIRKLRNTGLSVGWCKWIEIGIRILDSLNPNFCSSCCIVFFQVKERWRTEKKSGILHRTEAILKHKR
jgi:hypothetical protein